MFLSMLLCAPLFFSLSACLELKSPRVPLFSLIRILKLLFSPCPRSFFRVFFSSNDAFHRSHGFCIGHVVPEAQVGGPIALVKDGDVIAVDAVKNTIELRVSDEELEARRKEWKAPPLKVTQGTLYKYTKVVTDASHGCVTDA